MLLSQSHDSIVFASTRYCMCLLPNSACFLVLDTCQQSHMWLDKQRQLHSTWADAAGHSAAILLVARVKAHARPIKFAVACRFCQLVLAS